MRFLNEGEIPTIEMIRKDLKENPPGQGPIHLHVEFTYNAPFYLAYLLARLDQEAERPVRKTNVINRFRELILYFSKGWI